MGIRVAPAGFARLYHREMREPRARHLIANVACSPVQNQGWGLLTQVSLPGGGKLGIYQPRHARPRAMSVKKTVARRKEAPARARTKKKRSPRAR